MILASYNELYVGIFDGSTNIYPVKYFVYLDRVLNESNKQDFTFVFLILSSAIRQIKYNLPFINSVILQTDNAHCYQNNFAVYYIALINTLHDRHRLVE